MTKRVLLRGIVNKMMWDIRMKVNTKITKINWSWQSLIQLLLMLRTQNLSSQAKISLQDVSAKRIKIKVMKMINKMRIVCQINNNPYSVRI